MHTLALLSILACSRYWFDTSSADLGQLNVPVSAIQLDGDNYRLKQDALTPISGTITVEGLEGEQEWNQVMLTLIWAPALSGKTQSYGLSLWDLTTADEQDATLYPPEALLTTFQINASSTAQTVELEGRLAAPEDPDDPLTFSIALVAEDLSALEGDSPPLSGAASLEALANGWNDRSVDAEPSVSLTIEEAE